jgi:cupin fold WbuC family metalloprotein
MQNVFHSEHGAVGVSPDWIERLKKIALESPMRRARYCLHQSDEDLVHEMIIALARDCLFKPHKHRAKAESYHMIQGRMVFIMFDDEGKPIRVALLTPPGQGGMIAFRIAESIYHAVLPLDELVVYQETTSGPFVKDEATVAPWAPNDIDELRRFLERSAASSGVLAGQQERA